MPTGLSRQAETFKRIIRYANGDEDLSFPWFFPGAAADLIRKLLSVDPRKRPSMPEAMDHEFYAGLDFMELEKRRVEPPHIPIIESHADTSNFAEVDSDSEDDDEEVVKVRGSVTTYGSRNRTERAAPTATYDIKFPAFLTIK